MHFKIAVIGSGLSSLSFSEAYLEKQKSLDIISPDFKNFKIDSKLNSHLFNHRNIPPQMMGSLDKIRDYFAFNNFKIDKDSYIMGSLEFGGLSNYWGLQIDQNFSKDINCLNKINRNKLNRAFFEIANKIKILGKFNLDKYKYDNDYKIDNFFSKILKKKIKNYEITKPVLAISGQKDKKIKKVDLGKINESTSKINARNFYKKFLKKKKIRFHNFAVKSIMFKKNKFHIACENTYQKKNFTANKVILGCGTLVTTKLVLGLHKIKKEIKIKEHPRIITMFLSKHSIKHNLNFMPSQIQIKNSTPNKSFMVDLRPSNKSIIDLSIKIYKYLLPIKPIINFLSPRMIFSNILLDSHYSNLFMKLDSNLNAFIYSKKNKVNQIFNKIHKRILNFLINEKIVYPFYKNFYSGNGSAYHYFGTIPISKKKDLLTVNEKCQLNGFKNLYIIDGSVFNFKESKYPLAVVMANARRIGKEIKK